MSQKNLRDGLMDSSLSRRRLVGAGGAAFAAAMLAGGALPGTFGRAVVAQDGSAEYHAAYPYLDPGAGGHFNSFVTNAILPPPTTVYGDLILQPLGMYYWGTNEWLPLLATEWAFVNSGGGAATPAASPEATPEADGATPAAGGIDPNADVFEITLREGVTWSDDAPFTAQDVVDTLWCLRIMSHTVWKYIDDAQAVDDLTVQLHMSVPSTEVERYAIRVAVPRPSSVFGEWAQKARDLFAGGKTLDDPEGKQLLDQFNQFRPENVPASGPYMIDAASITNAQMTLVKNDKAWNAENARFDKIVNFNGETDTISAVVLSKDIDYATHGFAPATEKEMIANGIRVLRPPTYGGAALLFNYGQLTEFADKKVRQALAHAIDRDRAGQISLADSGVGVKKMAGMSDNLVSRWMSESDAAGLNGYEYDQEKAAALLQEAGWTKDGDLWKTPEGKDAAYELMFPAEFADYSATGQDLAAQLTEFGIQISPRAVTHTQVPIDVDQGKFQLAIQGWGSSTNPHPHYSFATAFFTHNTLAVNNGGKGMAFPLEQETEVAGKVDLEALTVASAEGLDQAQQEAQVTTIAQVFNELLNIIPIYERYGNNAALEGVRVKAWPADDDPILKNSPYADGIPTMLLLTGKLEPVSS